MARVARLANVDDGTKELLASAGAHTRVMAAMALHAARPRVQAEGCGTFRNLAWWLPASKKVLAAARAHLSVIAAMQLHEEDATVQTKACGALWALAASAETHTLLVGDSASSARFAATPTRRACRSLPAARSALSRRTLARARRSGAPARVRPSWPCCFAGARFPK